MNKKTKHLNNSLSRDRNVTKQLSWLIVNLEYTKNLSVSNFIHPDLALLNQMKPNLNEPEKFQDQD
jgi:hypothetical protein